VKAGQVRLLGLAFNAVARSLAEAADSNIGSFYATLLSMCRNGIVL
jgi:hypothetical protein